MKILVGIVAVALGFGFPAARAVDLEGDGHSDVFEYIYFGGPTSSDEDPDGDGFTNSQEMIWGTDPTNPLSYPTGITPSIAGSNLVLKWPAVPGKWYRLEMSTDLREWQTIDEGHISSHVEPLESSDASSGVRCQRLGVLAKSPDTDGNGLDDWEDALWQQTYGKSANQSDLDGDGLVDAQEFTLGRNPDKKDHPAVGLIVFTPLEK
jgi:hypothetical protein